MEAVSNLFGYCPPVFFENGQDLASGVEVVAWSISIRRLALTLEPGLFGLGE
jgi:hypothetical protein